MRAPFSAAWGSIQDRGLVTLRLEDRDGHVGFGEAAPLPDYHGVNVQDVVEALEACRPTLADGDAVEREGLVAECARLAVVAPAIAAIDLALWDLEGRRTGQPVWRMLDALAPDPVEVNYTIAASDRAGAAAEAAAARSAGFGCVKVKVGIGDDAGRLAAVRAVLGPAVAIRLDANGAWSVAEAIPNLRALVPVGIELCEEPVQGLSPIARVASALPGLPIALDETASAIGALEERVCQAVCLKITTSGGITGLLDAARRARSVGYDVYIASTLDGPVGIAAALHAAAAIRPSRPCGLATLGLFAGAEDPLPARAGRMAIPAGTGLGDRLMDWYRSAT